MTDEKTGLTRGRDCAKMVRNVGMEPGFDMDLLDFRDWDSPGQGAPAGHWPPAGHMEGGREEKGAHFV